MPATIKEVRVQCIQRQTRFTPDSGDVCAAKAQLDQGDSAFVHTQAGEALRITAITPATEEGVFGFDVEHEAPLDVSLKATPELIAVMDSVAAGEQCHLLWNDNKYPIVAMWATAEK